MVGAVVAHLKYLSLDIFLRYFDHSNRIHGWAWIHIAKTSWKLANFHMDFACYWLCMLDILMAHLNYLFLDIFLRYFDHSSRIPCVSMDPFSFVLAQANFYPWPPLLAKIYLWPCKGYMHKGPLKCLTIRCIWWYFTCLNE